MTNGESGCGTHELTQSPGQQMAEREIMGGSGVRAKPCPLQLPAFLDKYVVPSGKWAVTVY